MSDRQRLVLVMTLVATGVALAGIEFLPETRAQSDSVAATPKPPVAADAVKNPIVVPPKKDAEGDKAFSPARQLRRFLAEPTDKLKTGVDKGTPLKDALDYICQVHEVRPGVSLKYSIDHKAFANAGEPNIEEKQVNLPPMPKVPLSVILDRLLDSFDPPEARGTFRVMGGYIEITTRCKAESGDFFDQIVDVDIDKRPLDSALQELMDANGVSIVVDGTVGDKANARVTASFHRVSLRTVVRLLANMAELDVVPVENLLYVTSKEKATLLEKSNKRWQKSKAAQGGGAA